MKAINVVTGSILVIGAAVLLALGLRTFTLASATTAQHGSTLTSHVYSPGPAMDRGIKPELTTSPSPTIRHPSVSGSKPTTWTPSVTAPASDDASAWIPDPTYVNHNPVERDNASYRDAPGNPVTIGPGSVVTQYTDGTHTKMARCTVGFAGRLANGTKIAVTAGHCSERNNQPVMDHDAGDQVIGRYRVWQADGLSGAENDATGFAVVELLPNVIISSQTPYGAITGVGVVHTGDRVCKIGSTTGLTCGDVSYAADKTLIINLQSEPGDSGGPIIHYLTDDTFELVGSLNAQVTYADGPVRVVANPLTNMLSSLRENVDPEVKVYVR